MESKKEILLDNVKYAVLKYGMEGLTVRNIAEACGVNDSHIHRFFKNKEELLAAAYMKESTELFTAMIRYLDETKGVPLDFKTKARLHFYRIWTDMVSDPARLTLCICYYHSSCFSMAEEFHNQQVETLCCRLKDYFPNKQACVMTMYNLMAFLYDNAKRVVDGKEADTPQLEEMLFNQYYGLLACQLKIDVTSNR